MKKNIISKIHRISVFSIWLCLPTICNAVNLINSGHPVNIFSYDKNKIHNVLILGNSITQHGPKPSIGWQGNWGMAASAQNKDFVHLLETRFHGYSSDIKVNYGSIANTFERKFWQMDTSDFSKYKSSKPDLIILKIGENIKDSLAQNRSLNIYLEKLVGYLKTTPNAYVCLVGSFWPNKNIDTIMQKVCQKNNWLYVSLRGLYDNPVVNTAMNNFADKGVGMHPSDTGMKNIADRIWDKVGYLFNGL
ncbi:SGNH/GDSL hydrolase family protein [Dyadobacter sp. LHD-138]|uniref:SGNH/GDSL hydrolase family protein n=1 Tax=Dyadobacter sp. LHD-138 TaxID=3071413 RepID=UPI0027E1533F|nr:SGNH/GDSL hydrolase family protein [Dyadobacter sp. LHD-138]MDQ6481566.1 SGNH/GDSL hydrolase family protein [Dyadobacter sp. LHD-138]